MRIQWIAVFLYFKCFLKLKKCIVKWLNGTIGFLTCFPLHLGLKSMKTQGQIDSSMQMLLSQIHYLNPEREDDSNSISEMSSWWILPLHLSIRWRSHHSLYRVSIFYNRSTASQPKCSCFLCNTVLGIGFCPANNLPAPRVVGAYTRWLRDQEQERFIRGSNTQLFKLSPTLYLNINGHK